MEKFERKLYREYGIFQRKRYSVRLDLWGFYYEKGDCRERSPNRQFGYYHSEIEAWEGLKKAVKRYRNLDYLTEYEIDEGEKKAYIYTIGYKYS